MYGSIGGHYSSHYGNLNYSVGGGGGGGGGNYHAVGGPWRGSQHYIH
jgi:hypothetical protein